MIGIISRTEGEGSGAEVMLCHLLNNWHCSLPIVVITARNSSVARVAIANNIRLIEVSFTPEKIWPNVKAIEKSLKELKHIKLVHAWNSKSFELGWYIAKRLSVSLTCTMHDHPRSNYFTAKKLWLLKAIANNSAGLIAVSETLAEACRLNGYTCAIKIIQNGLPDLGKKREKIGLQPKVRVGFLGMNAAGKGFGIVADWMRNTATETNIEWHLFGNIYKDYEQLLVQLKTEGVQNFISWGRQHQTMIFENIDILVHASTIFDCYPTVLLEAARAGIPVIASSKGGAPEIVKHGETGFLFNPALPDNGLASLKALVMDKALYTTLSKNALVYFTQHFGIDQMVAKYKDFWAPLYSANKKSKKQVV